MCWLYSILFSLCSTFSIFDFNENTDVTLSSVQAVNSEKNVQTIRKYRHMQYSQCVCIPGTCSMENNIGKFEPTSQWIHCHNYLLGRGAGVSLNAWQTNGWVARQIVTEPILVDSRSALPPFLLLLQITEPAWRTGEQNDIQNIPFICFIIKLIDSLIGVRIKFFDHESKRNYLLVSSILSSSFLLMEPARFPILTWRFSYFRRSIFFLVSSCFNAKLN